MKLFYAQHLYSLYKKKKSKILATGIKITCQTLRLRNIPYITCILDVIEFFLVIHIKTNTLRLLKHNVSFLKK